jgi:hypothetical protein
MSLQNQIDGINVWKKIRGEKLISLRSLKQSDVDELAGNMDCQMSPENLHCDGEISHSAAMRKAREIRKAFDELKAYVAKRNLTMPKTYEIN